LEIKISFRGIKSTDELFLLLSEGGESNEEEVIDAEPIDVPCGSLGPNASGRVAVIEGRKFVTPRKDCNKYFTCQFGQLLVQSCPAGLYWNKVREFLRVIAESKNPKRKNEITGPLRLA